MKPVHIINVPLDLGASRRGTDAGPSAFRIAGLSRAVKRLGYDVTAETDIPVPAMETRNTDNSSTRFKEEILAVCESLAQVSCDAMQNAEIPLVIGGDHSIAMGTVSGISAHFRRQEQDLGLIWFDAHGDMNLPETSPSGNVHGMPLAHLLGHGDADLSNVFGCHPAVKPEHVVLIGIRDIDRGEREIIRKSGITAFTMRDIDEQGMSAIADPGAGRRQQGNSGFSYQLRPGRL